ncbi:hypothetical protein ACFLXA_06085 [Chloroflexota bacterium]
MVNDCKNFEECDAPLCPLEENEYHIWYPNEDICNLRKFQSLDWIKKQKLIARKHGSIEGFFNLKMLNATFQIRRGIIGANPDLALSAKADEKWIVERLVGGIKRARPSKKNRKLALAKRIEVGIT